jgi:hypothetical protein
MGTVTQYGHPMIGPGQARGGDHLPSPKPGSGGAFCWNGVSRGIEMSKAVMTIVSDPFSYRLRHFAPGARPGAPP